LSWVNVIKAQVDLYGGMLAKTAPLPGGWWSSLMT
jgi:hypothetical protein